MLNAHKFLQGFMVHRIHTIVLINTVAHLYLYCTPNKEIPRKKSDGEYITSESRKYNVFFFTIYLQQAWIRKLFFILCSAQHSPSKTYGLVGIITSKYNPYICLTRSQYILYLLWHKVRNISVLKHYRKNPMGSKLSLVPKARTGIEINFLLPSFLFQLQGKELIMLTF